MFPKIYFFKFRPFHNSFFFKALVTYGELFGINNVFYNGSWMFIKLKNVFPNYLHVFICDVHKRFCRSSLKYSELNFLYSQYKISQGLFLSNDVFNTLEPTYQSQIEHCILQRYFENLYFWLLGRHQWMLV